MKNLVKASTLFNLAGLVFAWIAIFVFFKHEVPNFGALDNFQTMARQCTVVAIATLGMTLIIISGGIDLSPGSVIAFVTVTIALLLQAKCNPWVALICGVAGGAIWGCVNGFLITRLKVVPFIVTLGTYLLVRGAAKGLADNRTIDSPTSWLNTITSQPKGQYSWLDLLNPSRVFHLFAPGVWITLACAILVAFMLRRTRFGRHIVAVGSNEQAARLCGVPVDSVKLAIYVLAGVTVGLAGLMQYSRLTVGDPTAADGDELKIIAAVVIGGASLNGGQGSILGSLLGAWIMTTISTGCAQMGLDNWVEQMVTGAIIVMAVAVDRIRVNGAEITLPFEPEARSGWAVVFAVLAASFVFVARNLPYASPPLSAEGAECLLFAIPSGIVGWIALGKMSGGVQSLKDGLPICAGGGVVSALIVMAIPWARNHGVLMATWPSWLEYGLWSALSWCVTCGVILLVQRVARPKEAG